LGSFVVGLLQPALVVAARLLGGPSLEAGCGRDFISAASTVRRARLSSVSAKSAAATVAGPRLSESSRTVMTCSKGGRRMLTLSPTFSSLAGLERSPFTDTRPPSTASTARVRVLKKRAAHSHLSSLMP